MIDGLTRDILIVGLTAYAEARGEGRDGIRAQVHSVVNRHAAGHWYSRKTLAGTCMLAYAYSANNTDDPNREIAAETPMDDPIMQMCMDEAEQAIEGVTEDPTGGATHYYAAGTPEPDWVSGVRNGKRMAPAATYCVTIGRHLFYRDVTYCQPLKRFQRPRQIHRNGKSARRPSPIRQRSGIAPEPLSPHSTTSQNASQAVHFILYRQTIH